MKLATRIFGENNRGNDLVLIHGTGARAEMWRRHFEPLVERGFRCIVPDLRGHGQSADPGGDTDIQAHLTDIVETLETVGVAQPAVFAGHSLGAIISLELAERKPELFKAILAVSMPGKVPAITTESFKWFLGWPYEICKTTKILNYMGWRPRVMMETDKRALEQIVVNFAGLNYRDRLPSVHCPVHFAFGRLDPVAPAIHGPAMQKLVPGSTLEVIEWAGHNCMDSNPTAFDRWFFSKLEEVSATIGM